MSLEKFQPTIEMLTEFYNNSVLILDDKQTITDSVEIEKPRFLGQFSKQILILVSHQHNQYLPDSEMELLTAILSACKMSFADIALINSAKLEISDKSELITFMNPKVVICFGVVDFLIQGIDPTRQFHIQTSFDKQFIHVPSLTDLSKDAAAKKTLWQSLKTIFGI